MHVFFVSSLLSRRWHCQFVFQDCAWMKHRNTTCARSFYSDLVSIMQLRQQTVNYIMSPGPFHLINSIVYFFFLLPISFFIWFHSFSSAASPCVLSCLFFGCCTSQRHAHARTHTHKHTHWSCSKASWVAQGVVRSSAGGMGNNWTVPDVTSRSAVSFYQKQCLLLCVCVCMCVRAFVH